MLLICPECGASLKIFSIKTNFSCPSCATELKGNINGPIIAAIILSIVADLIIYPIVYGFAGMDWWPGKTLRVLTSGAILIALYALMINKFGSVEAKDESSKIP